MKKISIITRAFNRLEYTIACINSVYSNTYYNNYEHIIINNASTDGTKEWLNWTKALPGDRFQHIRPIHLPKNYGDWGGMAESIKYLANDSKYVVQLDNDILVCPDWANYLRLSLENTESNISMLKRLGVQTHIKATNKRQIILTNGNLIDIADIPFTVACYIVRTAQFKQVATPKLATCRNLSSAMGGKAIKILNKTCQQIEGWNGKSYIQHKKYDPKLKQNWEK